MTFTVELTEEQARAFMVFHNQAGAIIEQADELTALANLFYYGLPGLLDYDPVELKENAHKYLGLFLNSAGKLSGVVNTEYRSADSTLLFVAYEMSKALERNNESLSRNNESLSRNKKSVVADE